MLVEVFKGLHIFPTLLGINTVWKVSVSEVFLVRKYVEIRLILPYSARIRANTEQKNSEYGRFLGSAIHILQPSKYKLARRM